jgi:uncharacterized membrane protein YdjX (TVP38/TMEM64 family)
MNVSGSRETGKNSTVDWLRKRTLPIAGLLIIIAIVAVIAFLYFRHRDILDNLQGYGYLGAFVISVILNATVIVPVSNMTIITALGAALPMPYLVGILGGIGAGIGEMTGYAVGRSGRDLLAKNKMYTRVERWVKRWGWIAVFVLSIFPLAFDIVGIIAGATRMPVWKYFVATWLGRTIAYVAMAYFGKVILNAIPWFN